MIFLACVQGSAAHGSDFGRASEENPFQHPDNDLSEQEHYNCDLLAHLTPRLGVNTSTQVQPRTESTPDPLLWPSPNTDSKRDWQNFINDQKKIRKRNDDFSHQDERVVRRQASPRHSLWPGGWSCADWLIFTGCGQCFYINKRLGPNKCAKPRGETDQSLQSFCSIMSFWKLAVCCPNKKSPHQRRQKEMPIQGFQFSYCCVIMNEDCFHPGCLALTIWMTLLHRHLSHQDWTFLTAGFFSSSFLFFFFIPFDFNITSSLLRCDV